MRLHLFSWQVTIHEVGLTINEKRTFDRAAVLRVAVFAAMLLVYAVFEVSGLVIHSVPWTAPLTVAAFIGMGVIAYFKPRIDELLEPHMNWLQVLICGALVLLSLFLLERPYVDELMITLPYVILNLCILGVLFGIIFFAAQRKRGAAMVVLTLCFIFGIANYFVITFKGQPVMPADLFALGTAAAVSNGYVYAITDSVVVAFTAFAAGLLLAMFLPKVQIDKKRVAANISVSLACLLAFGVWFSTTDIEEDYESYFYMFRPQLSYADYGSLLCFLSLVQQLDPPVPENYSVDSATTVLSSYEAHAATLDDAVDNISDNPSIVVIMNETFADLSSFEALAETYEGPTYFNSIDDAVLKGEAYVSVLGAGTCNSEFELLTGASMANLGSGYPYMNYNLSSAENMAGQLKDIGYETTAIHPDKATNWKRDVVYEDFGFEEFIDQSDFEDAETIRGFPRDKATYEKVLETLTSSSDPQFIFDVTMQNHGGYNKGEVPESVQVNAPINGIDHPELDEYLSSIKQSDQDLQFLIEELKALDEPVVLCFFGDHQPSIMNWLYEYLGYENLEDAGIDELQAFYQVPYMVWANYDVDESVVNALIEHELGFTTNEDPDPSVLAEATDDQGSVQEGSVGIQGDTLQMDEALASASTMQVGLAVENTTSIASTTVEFDVSLNYLGSFVMMVADLPLSPYQDFLVDLHAQIPVINANGYRDAAGVWYDLDDDEVLPELRARYELVQYDHLFPIDR